MNYKDEANPYNDAQLTQKFDWNDKKNKLSEDVKIEELNKIKQRRL